MVLTSLDSKTAAAVLLMATLQLSVTSADDWPTLGRDHSRNAVSPEKAAPLDWHVGEFDRESGAWAGARNVKWTARLGSQTSGDPVVADGFVWVGTNNAWSDEFDSRDDASVLACFRESDGKLLYRYVSPRLPQGRANDWPYSSMACSPLIEGDRLWFVTNRGETVCLDIGPLKREVGEPRVVWKLDMITELGVFPKGSHMALTRFCSVASYRDRIYVITGNGVDNSWRNLPAPQAPSLICVNKHNGTVMWSNNSPGGNVLSGQWSSPLVVEIDGQAQVIAPQGDGWVRSFDGLSGQLVWEFDMNPKTAEWMLGGRGTRNNVLAPPVFYDGRVYVASGQNAEHGEGLGRLCCIDPTKLGDISSELAVDAAGNPVPHRRFQAVHPENGEMAIANPNSGLVWEYTAADENGDGEIGFEEEFHRTLAGVAIKDDLLIAADFSGLVHCFDAQGGKRHWHYDAFAAIYAQPLIVDRKVYVPDEDGDVAVFHLSADPREAMKEIAGALHPINARLANGDAEVPNMSNSVYTSPILANGTLYVASRNTLFAIQQGDREAASRDRTAALPQESGYWPQWRGPNRDNLSRETGLLKEWPEGGPPLLWQVDGIGEGAATVSIAQGRIHTVGYIGEKEYAIALDQRSGQKRWATPIGPAVAEHPLMRWFTQRSPTVDEQHVYVVRANGDLVCLEAGTGAELWRKSYAEDFGAGPQLWGHCDYPLVDGERLIIAPGSPEAGLAALNKRTGEVIWRHCCGPCAHLCRTALRAVRF